MEQVPSVVLVCAIEILCGSIIIVGNVAVCITILVHKRLRVKNLLIAALCGSDLLIGFGLLTWGVTILSLHNSKSGLTIQPDCIYQDVNPFAFFPSLGFQASALLIFVIAIDRTVCVWFPEHYFSNIHRIPRIYIMIIGLVYAFDLLSLIYLIPAIEKSNCTLASLPTVIPKLLPYYNWFYVYFYSMLTFFGGSSLALYIVTIFGLKRNPFSRYSGTVIIGGQRRQCKQTILMGMIVTVNSCCLVLPSIGYLIVANWNMSVQQHSNLNFSLGSFQAVLAILDVFLYAGSSVKIRRELIRVLCWCRSQKEPRARPLGVIYAHYRRNGRYASATVEGSSSSCVVVLNRAHRAERY